MRDLVISDRAMRISRATFILGSASIALALAYWIFAYAGS